MEKRHIRLDLPIIGKKVTTLNRLKEHTSTTKIIEHACSECIHSAVRTKLAPRRLHQRVSTAPVPVPGSLPQSLQPCIRGMRITVDDVLGCLSSGMAHQQILDEFPYLREEDILACLSYAADRKAQS